MYHFQVDTTTEAAQLLTDTERITLLAKIGDMALDNPPDEDELLIFDWMQTIKIIVDCKNKVRVMTTEQYGQAGYFAMQSIPIQPD